MFWYDGKVSEEVPKIEITDRGLLLADAVFDTALAYRGKVVFAPRHEERFARWLDMFGITDALPTLAAPYAALSKHDYPVSVRVTVTRGSGPRGLQPPTTAFPRIFASAVPLPTSFVSRPVRLATSGIQRNSSSFSSTMKTTGYVDAVQAARIAAWQDCDDALFVNEHGHVACSTIANVFVALGEELYTPPISDGVVPGIIRGLLLEHLGAQERSLTVADLQSSDGVLLTNSLRLACPVTSIDGARLPSGAPFLRVQEFLLRAVRKDSGLDLSAGGFMFRPLEDA